MKVHFISPYSTDMPPNIGGAINEAVADLAAGSLDWICLTDHDTMWLLPDSKRQVIDTLRIHEGKYHLLSCRTNRLGGPLQLVSGMFNEDSIRAHVSCAKALQAKNWSTVDPMHRNYVAGFMLCFPVWLWSELGGFEENAIDFDIQFSQKVYGAGYKIGIMNGVYLLHLYRILSDNPRHDISHLLS